MTARTFTQKISQFPFLTGLLLVFAVLQMQAQPPKPSFVPVSGYAFKKLAVKHSLVTDTFRTAKWDQHSIDIYKQDMTEFKGYYTCYLNDTLRGLKFVFPLKQHQRITSPFGPRVMYGSNFHYGTDLKLNYGDTVMAALPGIVRVSRYDRGGYGNFVVVSHPNGLETLYGHLSKRAVQVGDRVAAGDLIGLGGSTGYSTGNHLHFEFRFLGEQFDPEKVVSFTSQQVVFDRFDVYASFYDHLVDLKAAKYHRIRSGDTLGAIARRYGTTIGAICRLNGISTKTILRIGRNLRVN